jgi:Fic-DOC domain mobile mystery protein B
VEGAVIDRPHSIDFGPIGPEPAGATPIAEEDLDGLIPDFVATRADLDRVEFESIARSLPRLLSAARSGGPESVLNYGFMLDVHRRMFSDVWRWAGTLRRRETNIGVEPYLITSRCIQCLDDALHWHSHHVYQPDEIAVRVHAQLVAVHPFSNGNGRCTRLIADLYLTSTVRPSFTWGAATLDVDGAARQRYLAALIGALHNGDYGPLVAFARS